MTLPIPLYGFVVEDGIKEISGKSGRYYHYAVLRTNSGLVKTRIWSASADKLDLYPNKGNIVVIDNFKDQMDSHDSIVINSYRKIIKESLPESEKNICEFPKYPKADVIRASQYLVNPELYEDQNNRNFVSKCFCALKDKDIFLYPGGEKLHHALGGGLIIHTAEVVKIAKSIYDACKMPFISNDVVVAGAALHDIGKFQTYVIDEAGSPSRAIIERIVGHLCLGIELVRGVGAENLMDQTFVDEVCHCIATHHGKPEYGNIKSIQSLEALIVHCADLISSRNNMIETRLGDGLEGLPDVFNIASDSYFITAGMRNYINRDS